VIDGVASLIFWCEKKRYLSPYDKLGSFDFSLVRKDDICTRRAFSLMIVGRGVTESEETKPQTTYPIHHKPREPTNSGGWSGDPSPLFPLVKPYEGTSTKITNFFLGDMGAYFFLVLLGAHMRLKLRPAKPFEKCQQKKEIPVEASRLCPLFLKAPF